MDAIFSSGGAPGPPEKAVSMPLAIVAPHIDPPRGGPVYAHAYARIWGTKPERIVVLGIAHGGSEEPFVLTAKGFETPFGLMECDLGFVNELVGRLDWDPMNQEEIHQWEHSVEFQVVFAQYATAMGRPNGHGGTKAELVPVLCSFSWEDVWLEDSPRRGKIHGFLEALGELLSSDDRSTLLIAGVDLAHVGGRFGDPPADDETARSLERLDMKLLDAVAAGEREAFVSQIALERNARRVCGFPAIYSLMTHHGKKEGQVLRYGSSLEESTASVVSYAALVFP